jgi:hypothetical protein
MPRKNKEEYNAYMKEYMLRRYNERRQEAIAFLGGKCVICGSEENLNFHHVGIKTFSIAKLWNLSADKFWAEIKKCEIRCEEHHKEIHHVENEHGTPQKYWQGCRCHSCTIAYNNYCKEYRYQKGLRKRP